MNTTFSGFKSLRMASQRERRLKKHTERKTQEPRTNTKKKERARGRDT